MDFDRKKLSREKTMKVLRKGKNTQEHYVQTTVSSVNLSVYNKIDMERYNQRKDRL